MNLDRDREQTIVHESLKNATAWAFIDRPTQHKVGSEEPVTVDQDVNIDTVVGRGDLRDASSPKKRNKGVSLASEPPCRLGGKRSLERE